MASNTTKSPRLNHLLGLLGASLKGHQHGHPVALDGYQVPKVWKSGTFRDQANRDSRSQPFSGLSTSVSSMCKLEAIMKEEKRTREIGIFDKGVANTHRPFYRKSWALVIGINYHQASAPPLANARNDAEALAKTLRDLHNFDVSTLYDDEATQGAILEWLRDRLPDSTGEDDQVVLFFAGHGMTRKGKGGEVVGGYLIPYIPRGRGTGYGQYIDMDELKKACFTIPAKHILILLDCCFSGVAAVTARAAPPAPPKRLDDAYLQRITQRPAYQILTAGAADELAADGGPRPGHSAYTGALLQGLEGGADLDDDGLITASALAAYISPLVSRETSHTGGHGQTPFFNYLAGSGEGDMVFFLPDQVKKVQPVGLPDEIYESMNSLKPWDRLGVVHTLGNYLTRDNEALALAAHAALQSMREDDSQQVRKAVGELLSAYEKSRQGIKGVDMNEERKVPTSEPPPSIATVVWSIIYLVTQLSVGFFFGTWVFNWLLLENTILGGVLGAVLFTFAIGSFNLWWSNRQK